MLELLGWLGLLLIASALAPLLLKYCRARREPWIFLRRHHHYIALASLAILTLHGLLALTWRPGRGWGARGRHAEMISTGVLAWAVLLAICLLALYYRHKNQKSRIHCWLAALLLALLLLHI
ncbi:hypothetical protein DCCM_2116 [Desulfocucumis palustris]|uniref:Ferric oxidoreductase domain-containing protein n=1 Tax=Desulfocucumis palustris TaxID=1898651 RepID=A0A2L2X9U0_9FIRM|nr:hypothetical protein [Desulfocucumis palustris]GBF33019.1 hypothetical protein DCCM_2116 [Desulfocucumis palustris]